MDCWCDIGRINHRLGGSVFNEQLNMDNVQRRCFDNNICNRDRTDKWNVVLLQGGWTKSCNHRDIYVGRICNAAHYSKCSSFHHPHTGKHPNSCFVECSGKRWKRNYRLRLGVLVKQRINVDGMGQWHNFNCYFGNGDGTHEWNGIRLPRIGEKRCGKQFELVNV
jgi:hypothetical protein